MAIEIPPDIPNRTKWCQVCGKYTASPVDAPTLRRLLAAKGVPGAEGKLAQAHPGCYAALKAEVDGEE
jgi:hypothetical protein